MYKRKNNNNNIVSEKEMIARLVYKQKIWIFLVLKGTKKKSHVWEEKIKINAHLSHYKKVFLVFLVQPCWLYHILEINLFHNVLRTKMKKSTVYIPWEVNSMYPLFSSLFPLQKQTFRNIRRSLFYVFFLRITSAFLSW